MTVRELIAYARANGWEHLFVGGPFGREHVWRCARWKVIAEEVMPGTWKVCLFTRARSHRLMFDVTVAEVYATHPSQVVGVLLAFGVIHEAVAA